MDKNGRMPTNTDERIQLRIDALQREQAEFALVAPMRADERMQALRVQLQMEIDLRMMNFEQQIADLQALLRAPDGQSEGAPETEEA